MIIKEVSADGYKNLEDIKLVLDPKMNIVCGENAQGKTNLIEAVWLCSGCRSFRGTKDKNFIGFEKDTANVKMLFSDSQRDQEIGYSIKKTSVKDKNITLNGVKVPLFSRLFGNFRCVVFTPEDLKLTRGSPEKRRSFIDFCIAQVKPSYINVLNTYNGVLEQRNALLRSVSGTDIYNKDQLEVYNEQLAKTGSYISVIRYTFSNILNKYIDRLYSSITNGNEKMNIYYQSTIFKELKDEKDYKDKLFNIYMKKLIDSTEIDIKTGFTRYGIHRDELGTYINGLPVREFGSQGQARSAALAMKLAQAEIIRDQYKEAPVMLLDDVLSELDPMRKRFILNNIKNMQVIITCCDSRSVTEMASGKIFEIKKGRIV